MRRPQYTGDEFILERLPDSLQKKDKRRRAWTKGLTRDFLLTDAQSWAPGQSLRVAFQGGDPELHRKIEKATHEITNACDLTLDFGFDGQNFRSWSHEDQQYAAEIRVGFDMDGYWSLVGNDSINRSVGDADEPVGGRPYQQTLNLDQFPDYLPAGWYGVVLHEFMHAVGFHHEHQNMRGPCQDEFRWEDDPGYVPTRNARGTFILDTEGRRPGIYTYLRGPPNEWDKDQIDDNLRTAEDPDVVAGPFDPASVMLYRFPPFFYKQDPSPCAPTGDGQSLSEGDRRGLQLLYPGSRAEAQDRVIKITKSLQILDESAGGAAVAVPKGPALTDDFAKETAKTLRHVLSHFDAS